METRKWIIGAVVMAAFYGYCYGLVVMGVALFGGAA